MIRDHLALWRARWESLTSVRAWPDTCRHEVENLAREVMSAYQDACERLDDANKECESLRDRNAKASADLRRARDTIDALLAGDEL